MFDDSAIFPSVALGADLAANWKGEEGDVGQQAWKEMMERLSGS